jgi:hypothetical protein
VFEPVDQVDLIAVLLSARGGDPRRDYAKTSRLARSRPSATVSFPGFRGLSHWEAIHRGETSGLRAPGADRGSLPRRGDPIRETLHWPTSEAAFSTASIAGRRHPSRGCFSLVADVALDSLPCTPRSARGVRPRAGSYGGRIPRRFTIDPTDDRASAPDRARCSCSA